MPAGSDDGRRRYLIAVGASRYGGARGFSDLPSVEDDVRRIQALLARYGYQSVLPQISLNAGAEAIRSAITSFYLDFGLQSEDIVAFYFSGHGAEVRGGRHYLWPAGADERNPAGTGIATADVGRWLMETGDAPPENVLLMFDVCYAGAGSAALASEMVMLRRQSTAEQSGITILAAGRAVDEADQGAFVSALETVLEEYATANRNQRYLHPVTLAPEMSNWLKAHGHQQRIEPDQIGGVGQSFFFPNLRYDERWAGANIERLLEWLREDRAAHWEPRARGVEVPTEAGEFFTGRAAALSTLLAWLRSAQTDGGMRVVVGGPGSGKSTLLSRLVVIGSDVDVPLHARKRNVADLSARLGELAGCEARTPGAVIAELKARAAALRIVVDALDEANGPEEIASQLLRPLVDLPCIRLIVGSRPTAASEPGRRRVAFLGDRQIVLDLDTADYFEVSDLAASVEKRLLAPAESGYRANPSQAEAVATAVATRAQPSFLVAALVGRDLARSRMVSDPSDPAWQTRLPATVHDALTADLRRFGDSEQKVRDLLTPLAYALGRGLPQTPFWPLIASALATRTYANGDVEWLKREAGFYITPDLEDGVAVYRLYHEALAESLRRGQDHAAIHRSIVSVIEHPGRPGELPRWELAQPYALRHRASHMALAHDGGAAVRGMEEIDAWRALLSPEWREAKRRLDGTDRPFLEDVDTTWAVASVAAGRAANDRAVESATSLESISALVCASGTWQHAWPADLVAEMFVSGRWTAAAALRALRELKAQEHSKIHALQRMADRLSAAELIAFADSIDDEPIRRVAAAMLVSTQGVAGVPPSLAALLRYEPRTFDCESAGTLVRRLSSGERQRRFEALSSEHQSHFMKRLRTLAAVGGALDGPARQTALVPLLADRTDPAPHVSGILPLRLHLTYVHLGSGARGEVQASLDALLSNPSLYEKRVAQIADTIASVEGTDEALRRVRALSDPRYVAKGLARVARVSGSRRSLLHEAERMAQLINDRAASAAAVLRLCHYVSVPEADSLRNQALVNVAPYVGNPLSQSQTAWRVIMPALSHEDRTQLYTSLRRSLDDDRTRYHAAALAAAVAAQLEPESQQDLLAWALSKAPPGYAEDILRGLAPTLASDELRRLWAENADDTIRPAILVPFSNLGPAEAVEAFAWQRQHGRETDGQLAVLISLSRRLPKQQTGVVARLLKRAKALSPHDDIVEVSLAVQMLNGTEDRYADLLRYLYEHVSTRLDGDEDSLPDAREVAAVAVRATTDARYSLLERSSTVNAEELDRELAKQTLSLDSSVARRAVFKDLAARALILPAIDENENVLQHSIPPERASELPEDLLRPIWSRSLHAFTQLGRPRFLDNLGYYAPVVASLGGEAATLGLAREILAVQQWWP